MMKPVISVCVLLFACAAFAERQPLSRYQSIIDRQMFGQPPPGFDPTKPASEVAASSRAEEKALTKEQEQLQSSIQFSVINITPEGETAVGFSDNSDPKAPKHYYLKVGEERDGWLVKEANPTEASMTIAKGEIEVSLKIGENSAKGGTTAKTEGGAAAQASRLGGGLRARRMARLAEQRQLAAADAKKAEEAKADQEAKEAQREAQRQAEREEQRNQLMAIQEELKRAREARQQQQQQESEENAGNDGQ